MNQVEGALGRMHRRLDAMEDSMRVPGSDPR
jgi:hypothetical protein